MKYGLHDWDDINWKVMDHAIGGKLVVGKTIVSEAMTLTNDMKDVIKRELLSQMIEFILENKLVEFTQYTEPNTHYKCIMIRAYLAKDADIKILRTHI